MHVSGPQTRVLRELADDGAPVHRSRVDLKDGRQRLPLPDSAVLRRDFLARSCGHETPLQNSPAALGIALEEVWGEALIAPEPAIQLQARRQPHLSRYLHHGRYQDEDACGVEVLPTRKLLVSLGWPSPQNRVENLELCQQRQNISISLNRNRRIVSVRAYHRASVNHYSNDLVVCQF